MSSREAFTRFPSLGFSASPRIKEQRSSAWFSNMSGSFFSLHGHHWPESLRSIGITRLQHYYALIWLPKQPRYGYSFPQQVESEHAHNYSALSNGVSQVPDLTVDARCPLSPRIARKLLPYFFVFGDDFVPFGRIGHNQWCYETEPGSRPAD